MDNRKRLLPFATGLLLLGVAFFLLYQRPVHVEFSGATMGTSYLIKISALSRETSQNAIEQQTFAVLDQVDHLMSTYKADSDISRFNRSEIDQPVQFNRQTLDLVRLSKSIYERSNGSFDITVAPVVRLWGFGPEIKEDTLPSTADINRALDTVGFNKIQVSEYPPTLTKIDKVEIDLSAIAKGYGVDQVAELFAREGIENYLIEVGGEIRVKGTNKEGQLWRIGIETPSLVRTGARQAVAIHNLSIATSGDYRNFFEIAGKRYSHTINPVTGRPVDHGLASVTVVMPSCAEADAYATALSVLGPDEGYRLAEEMNLSAYFLVRDGEDYQEIITTGFRDLLENQSIQQ